MAVPYFALDGNENLVSHLASRAWDGAKLRADVLSVFLPWRGTLFPLRAPQKLVFSCYLSFRPFWLLSASFYSFKNGNFRVSFTKVKSFTLLPSWPICFCFCILFTHG